MKSKILSDKKVFEGFFNVRQKTIEHDTFSGDTITIDRLVIEGGDSVSGIVYNPISEQVYLVQQYRATVDNWIIEAPAGMIDEGETPMEAFVREVREELGVSLKHIFLVPYTHGNIGTKTGKSYHFFATTTDEPISFAGENEQEDIKVVKYYIADLDFDIRKSNVIIDPKIRIPYTHVKAFYPEFLIK